MDDLALEINMRSERATDVINLRWELPGPIHRSRLLS